MKVENYTGSVTKIPIMSVSAANGAISERAAIVLLPGVNEVDPAHWAEAEKIALVKAHLENGARRGGFVAGDPKKSIKSLADLKERDAIDLVEECVDARLLATWRANEKREKVSAAVEAQIEKIDPRKG